MENKTITTYLDASYGWTVKLPYKTIHFTDKATAVARGKAMAVKLGCDWEVK